MKKTLEILRRQYYWPGMVLQVRRCKVYRIRRHKISGYKSGSDKESRWNSHSRSCTSTSLGNVRGQRWVMPWFLLQISSLTRCFTNSESRKQYTRQWSAVHVQDIRWSDKEFRNYSPKDIISAEQCSRSSQSKRPSGLGCLSSRDWGSSAQRDPLGHRRSAFLHWVRTSHVPERRQLQQREVVKGLERPWEGWDEDSGRTPSDPAKSPKEPGDSIWEKPPKEWPTGSKPSWSNQVR